MTSVRVTLVRGIALDQSKQIERRMAIRRLDDAYMGVGVDQILLPIAKRLLTPRPADFPVKRLDALELNYLETLMEPFDDELPEFLSPVQEEFLTKIRKVNNYET